MSKGDALKQADKILQLKQARIDLRKEGAKLASCYAQKTLDNDRYAADLRACDKSVVELNKIIRNRTAIVETVPWTQSTWFAATIAIIITAAITIPVTWMVVTETK